MLTIEEVKKAMPSHVKIPVTQEMVDQLNKLSNDPIAAENMRNNFISYTSVMREGRFKLEDYVYAVVYVSYKLMRCTNQEAYKRTFPQRYQKLVADGRSDKEISSYVAAYAKGKLVNLIMEQTLIPSWILNQETYQKAINTQAELMMTATSEKVRTEAANSILTHLKRPETKQVELSIGARDDTGMRDLKDTLAQLAEQQRSLIENGVPTQQIAHQKLIESKVEDAVEI